MVYIKKYTCKLISIAFIVLLIAVFMWDLVSRLGCEQLHVMSLSCQTSTNSYILVFTWNIGTFPRFRFEVIESLKRLKYLHFCTPYEIINYER